MALLARALRNSIFNVETRLLQALGIQNGQGWPPPSFEFVGVEQQVEPQTQNEGGSLLEAILGKGILWAAVPKHRRSLERRMQRRMGKTKIDKYMTPKKNILECLECGHWHEAHTICGNCYEKVRKETEIMQESMPENERLANVPQTEVVYLYQDEKEEKSKHNGKFIVEVEKPRPQWWPKNLLTKGHRG